MSNTVFISGDFSSGTTLLFTLFRALDEFHCLYEPLHERLLDYLIHPLRPDERHHPFVDSYFAEYKGFREIPRLFNPEWGVSGLHLSSTAPAEDLHRYWSYLIGTALGHKPKVALKENRIVFRLGWLRARFPQAKIIHIYRDREEQWKSIVSRGQEYLAREDIGQRSVNFTGFNVARWCEDLKVQYPELDAKHFTSGYDRFSALWALSFAEHRRYADISVDLNELVDDFGPTCRRLSECVGMDFDVARLEPLVLRPEQRKKVSVGATGLSGRLTKLLDKVGRKYAKVRLLVWSLLGRRGTCADSGLLSRRRAEVWHLSHVRGLEAAPRGLHAVP